MPSTDFNYAILLSLDRAQNFSRARENSIGTQDLVLGYELAQSGAREDALDWLEANRLTLTDPEFTWKEYEGTWSCVSISYNERDKRVLQRFKQDGSFTDTVSDYSASSTSARYYYPKAVSPDTYDIPLSPAVGDVWSKRVQDNGDGTFDVVLIQTTDVNQTTTSYDKTEGTDSVTVVNTAAVAPIADPSTSAQGTTKRVVNRPTDSGLYQTSSETTIVSELDTGKVEFEARWGTGWVRTINNSDTADGGIVFVGGNSNSLRSAKNDDGTFNVSAVSTPIFISGEGGTDYDNYDESIPMEIYQFRENGTEQRVVSKTLELVGSRSLATVKTFLTDCHDVTFSPNGTGTYYQGKGYKMTATPYGDWEAAGNP